MIDGAIDHVAIAVHDIAAAIPFYTDILGASFLYAGEEPEPGFRWAQFGFARGGKVELVTPLREGSFLDRFLRKHGEGVHHVTIKVPDIVAALSHLERRGVPVQNVSIAGPEWKEAFIHPRDANGTLLQIAQAAYTDEEMARRHVHPEPGEGGHRHLVLADLMETGREASDEAAGR